MHELAQLFLRAAESKFLLKLDGKESFVLWFVGAAVLSMVLREYGVDMFY
jgi:hypothetical protein